VSGTWYRGSSEQPVSSAAVPSNAKMCEGLITPTLRASDSGMVAAAAHADFSRNRRTRLAK
jgi:hypothetical protein